MRLLAIDFGRTRIGCAVGETDHTLATPRTPLLASGTLSKDATAIHALAKLEEVDQIVIGLPLNDGQESPMSKVCRKLGEQIMALGWTVSYVDEAMTSHEAEASMREAGLKGSERRKHSDGEAACLILERYFATSS